MLEAGYIVVRLERLGIDVLVRANHLSTGMAARLSADLGLHMTVTKHLASGIMTERDVKIRATTFWGVFIHEVYAA